MKKLFLIVLTFTVVACRSTDDIINDMATPITVIAKGDTYQTIRGNMVCSLMLSDGFGNVVSIDKYDGTAVCDSHEVGDILIHSRSK